MGPEIRTNGQVQRNRNSGLRLFRCHRTRQVTQQAPQPVI